MGTHLTLSGKRSHRSRMHAPSLLQKQGPRMRLQIQASSYFPVWQSRTLARKILSGLELGRRNRETPSRVSCSPNSTALAMRVSRGVRGGRELLVGAAEPSFTPSCRPRSGEADEVADKGATLLPRYCSSDLGAPGPFCAPKDQSKERLGPDLHPSYRLPVLKKRQAASASSLAKPMRASPMPCG